MPLSVEQTHLYHRLENLFPDHGETITLAGALHDPKQAASFEGFSRLLLGEFHRELRVLGTEEGLRNALSQGRLARGLIRTEAREWLRRA